MRVGLILFFSTKQSRVRIYLTIVIDNRNLTQTKAIKFFGLYIDEYLGWDTHIKHILGPWAPTFMYYW